MIQRSALGPKDEYAGPLIIEEAETTLVIPHGWTVRLGVLDSVIAERIEWGQTQ